MNMNNMRQVVLLLLLLLTSSSVYTQTTTTVRGVVRDKKETLVGVNVVLMNAENRVFTGVITDIHGGYILKVPIGAKELFISYSFIGYKMNKVPYTGQKVLNVKLEPDMVLIDEVVVTGTDDRNEMGVSYKNLTSSTERMKLEGMEEMPVTSLGDALQGKLANVDIIASSGAPGSGLSIRIRGISSLSTSSEPLIVLDGIPKETDFGEDFDFATADEEDISGLVNLSPGDIESIEVLKDAAATAIYGTRGANGVLLITTKKGTVGKMTISFNQKVSFNFEPPMIEQLNGRQYITLLHDELWNYGLETKLANVSDNLTSPEINFDPTYTYADEFNQNTDWLGEVSQDAILSETTASMSGGGERTLYNFSVGYLTENGTTVGTDYKRLTSRLNLTYKFSDRFRVSMGVAFSQGNRGSNYSSSTRGVAMKKMPNLSPYVMEDDGVTRTSSYFTPKKTIQGEYSSTYNVVAMARESRNEDVNRSTDLNLTLVYDLFKGLRYTGIVGFDVGTAAQDAFLPIEATGVLGTNNNYNQGKTSARDNTQLYVMNKLIFNKSFNNKHTITSTLMLDITDKRNNSRETTIAGIGSPDLSAPILGSGKIISYSSGIGRNRDYGAIFNVHYNLMSKYMLNMSYRYGANSRMNNTNRWIGLPSASIAWRFSNEEFMKELSWLSDMKFRLSWGLNASAPGGTYPGAGRFKTEDNYGTNGAVGPSSMELTKLKWQTVEKINTGVDIAFFNDKLRFTFDYYMNTTKDLLQRSANAPSYIGYSTLAYFNSGKMRNEGWEFRGETGDILESNDFVLTLRFNMSGNKNIMVELPDNIDYMQYPEVMKNGEYGQSVEEGDAFGSFYGFRSLGVYKDDASTLICDAGGNTMYDLAGKPIQMRYIGDKGTRIASGGDAIYDDVNKDGVIDKYDLVYIGNSMPKFTGGGGFSVGYKGLRLTTYFHARLKYNIINDARMRSENMQGYDNQSIAVLSRWRYEGDETDIPKALFKNGYNWLGSDRFVEDGSFIRMKELSLKYTFPNKSLKRYGINKLSVFVTGYDLFIWSKYSGQNPEVSINGGLGSDGKFNLGGKDTAKTPKPRRLSMGLSIQF